MNAYSQVALSVANDDGLSQIFYEDLSPEVRQYVGSNETVRLQMWVTASMFMIETNYHQSLSGTISDASWNVFRSGLTHLFDMGAFWRYWETRQDLHSMEFRTLVDDQIEAAQLRLKE